MDRQPKRAGARTSALWGVLVAGMGLFVVLAGIGVIPVERRAADAPPWVIACAGLVFVLGGLALMVQAAGGAPDSTGVLPAGAPRWMRPAQALLALGIVVGLALVCSWIAFGPGERQFGGSFSGVLGDQANERVGRVVFGAGAVLTWLFAAAVTVKAVRRRV